MAIVAQKPESLLDVTTHYCPGCGHGVVHRLVAEVIDEFGIRETTIGVSPVGCSILAYNYLDIDFAEAIHGRAPAIATGIKRMHPDKIVFTYQGDGDLISIGGNEILHAANRGEKITVIFINNAIYGMTGGQMAPTTIPGQKTTTTPLGRSVEREGPPIRVVELLNTLQAPSFLARVSTHDAKNIMKAKKAIRKAFQMQIEGKGFSLVEVLSNCTTNWKLEPATANRWIAENMLEFFPLGTVRE
ncbi:MAG TPA: thiamine pyrophosphate-dependent enzyme [bacterium]|nr:thiamine pyrophosphate-dependent enzyme [bacterium]